LEGEEKDFFFLLRSVMGRLWTVTSEFLEMAIISFLTEELLALKEGSAPWT